MNTKSVIAVLQTFACGLALQAQAAQLPGLEQCGNLVSSGIFLTDYSGTMMQKIEVDKEELTRVALSKKLTAGIQAAMPEKSDVNFGVGSIAPLTLALRPGKHTPENFSKGLEKLPDELEIFGRNTNLGEGFQEIINDSARHENNRSLTGQKDEVTKLVVFTDGDETNRGKELMEVLPGIKEARPNLRVTWISFADTDETKKAVQTLADISGSSVYDGMTLLKDKEQLKAFIAREFYRECEDFSFAFSADTLFAFDRSNLSEVGKTEIQEAAHKINAYASLIKAAGMSLSISAHTDRIGTDAYNQKLSERRLVTVLNALEVMGVDMTLFSEKKAMGETQPVTGNKCDRMRGKRLVDCLHEDRRVEIHLK